MLSSKIIKMSICILCLGAIVSGSMVAMENNQDFPENVGQNIASHQEKVESNVEDDGIDMTECNKLKSDYRLSEEQAKKAIGIFKSKIKEGKSEHYASKYTVLKVFDELSEKRIERLSEIYEQKMKEICNANYANKYAVLKVFCGLSDRQAEIGARAYMELVEENLSEIEIDEGVNLKILMEEGEIKRLSNEELYKYLRLFIQELKSGKSRLYAHEYVVLKIKNYDDSRARPMAEMYYLERIVPKTSDVYAREYTNLVLNYNVDRQMARKFTEIFVKYIANGKEYARTCAKAMIYYNATEEQARKIAEIYLETVKSGKNRFYAMEYARLTVMPQEDKDLRTIEKMAEVFGIEMIMGRGMEGRETFARKCAKLMVIDRMSRAEASYVIINEWKRAKFLNMNSIWFDKE